MRVLPQENWCVKCFECLHGVIYGYIGSSTYQCLDVLIINSVWRVEFLHIGGEEGSLEIRGIRQNNYEGTLNRLKFGADNSTDYDNSTNCEVAYIQP